MNDDAIHNDHVREDGTVDDQVVETFYRSCEGLMVSEDGQYVRVIIDDGAVNVETRIAFSTLEKAGFYRNNVTT